MTEGQVWNAEQYEKNARFVSDLGMPVVELLGPKPGERILDLGCGDGALTKKLADLGCELVAVDASEDFVTATKKLGLDARISNGENLSFENEFDAVFTNAALHWMLRSEDVVKGVHRALKPGGRFVGECAGKGNVATIVKALEDSLRERNIDPAPYNPWCFLSDIEYRRLLENNGFEVKQIALITRPTPLPADVVNWLETFAGSYARAISPNERSRYFEDVRKRLKSKLFVATENRWVADYVRLRFSAVAN